MKDMQVLHEHDEEDQQKHDHQGDLKDGLVFENDIIIPNPNSYETMNWEEEVMAAEDLLHVDDTLMSYGDFPPLPDFPCISSSASSSSSSCSSSAHHPVNISHNHHAVTCSNNNSSSSSASSSSSSSASSSASWAVVKPDHGEESVENRQDYALLSTDSMEIHQDEINRMDSADCMDVMEGLGDMDLLDTDDIWDPSSLFPYEDDQDYHDQQQVQNHEQEEKLLVERERGHDDDEEEEEEKENNNNKPSEDLALVFLEWLKSNKESISAEDLRSIKLKRSTIECAAQKLGGGKEGMKQLLKLILEWVQNHHLQKKRMKEGQASSIQNYHQENPNANSSEHLNYNSFTPESNPCFNTPIPSTPWNITHHPQPPPPYVSDPMMSGSPSSYPTPTMHGFMGDPSLFVPHFNQNPYSSSSDYMLDSSQNWPPPPPPPPHFSLSSHYTSYPADSHHHLAPSPPPPPPPPTLSRSFSNYQNQYPPCHQMFQGSPGDGSLIKLGSSATKEARKKRMARQRRFFSHHQRHNQQPQHHHHHQTNTEQQTRLVSDNNCTTTTQAANNQANWVYWSSSPPSAAAAGAVSMSPMLVSDGPPPPADPPPMQTPNYQRQVNMERRHGCKPEKNLKFLLQKVLKQSDVGNLGRIVLPKKEAETYLPELEARDGISIAMEDIGTSRIWNMRYRFWPNNKSRMYLLENTGDFVRSNGLQEGDFIVIYSDIKGGKYMIRGVKVRQPGSKSEAKKSAKAHRNLHANSPPGCDGSSSSSMIKQAVA